MIKSGFVAIVGRPNAGKSTLLNSILGSDVSIVTPKAQTTRERVLGILSEEQGQMIFVDTPGIHKAKDGGINEFMVSEAKQALEAPNVVWYVLDPRSALRHELEVINLVKHCGAPVFLLLNKVDVMGVEARAQASAMANAVLGALTDAGLDVQWNTHISALKKKGIKELVEKSWTLLPEGPLYYPDQEQLSDRPVRFFVSEKIREQLFLQMGDEIPYSCAIEIDKFEEAAKPPRIEATIHVERDSQKGMVIGKGGVKIKEIGQAARKEVEIFMGAHVFLGLKVKVTKDWSKDEQALKRFGYQSERRKK